MIVHGDEGHAHPVTQVFYRVDYQKIENLIWSWGSLSWEEPLCCEELEGRVLSATVALMDASKDCLGWLHLSSSKGLGPEIYEVLPKFAEQYLARLLDICVLSAAPFEPEPALVVQHRSLSILSRLESDTQALEPEPSEVDDWNRQVFSESEPEPGQLDLESLKIWQWANELESEWVDLQDWVLRDCGV